MRWNREMQHIILAERLTGVTPHLRAVARCLCGRVDLADDLVLASIAVASASFAGYRPDTDFKVWIFGILHDRYVSQRSTTAQAARRGIEAAIPLEPAEVWCALRRLPDEQREALILVGAGGFSEAEAATIARCAIGTIKRRADRARAALDGRDAAGPGARALPSFVPSRLRRPSRRKPAPWGATTAWGQVFSRRRIAPSTNPGQPVP